MKQFKLYGKCTGCRRNRFFVRQATVKFPIGNLTATSKDLLCGKHIKLVRAKIN